MEKEREMGFELGMTTPQLFTTLVHSQPNAFTRGGVHVTYLPLPSQSINMIFYSSSSHTTQSFIHPFFSYSL